MIELLINWHKNEVVFAEMHIVFYLLLLYNYNCDFMWV